MHYKEEDKERANPDKKGRNSELDLEGPTLNKPLFNDNDRDPDVEPGDWNYEALF